MDEPKQDDNQAADTSANDSSATGAGQVMDVTGPPKQIDVTESAPEQETPADTSAETAPDSSPEQSAADAAEFTPDASESSEAAPEVPEALNTAEPEFPPAAVPETSEPEVATAEASPAESSVETPAGAAPETPAEATPTETPAGVVNAPHSQPHKTTPIMAIVAAVVIAIAIAGAVVFMYLKNQNGDIKRTDSSTPAVVEKPQASASDVDAANQTIDTNLEKADDNKDFPTASMSDTALGL